MPDLLKTTALSLLKIPSLLYTLIMSIRNLVYDLVPGLSHEIDRPTICVGNLTSGGTGKTPMVAFLAGYFQSLGLRVAVLSRGYGRTDKNSQVIITANSDLHELRPDKIGDEALMLHRQLPDIALVLDKNRVRGAEAISRRNLADIIVLDDGFQHRRLRRDFNIVMIDSQQVFGNQWLLPAGPLREPLNGLCRADAVIFNKFDQCHPEFYALAAGVLNYISPQRVFISVYHYRRFTALSGEQSLSPAEMHKLNPFSAVSGLANNDYFLKQLKATGFKLKNSLSFRDHHVYSDRDISEIKDLCRDSHLLTTAKDADKLKSVIKKDDKLRRKIWIAEVELKLEDKNRFLKLIRDTDVIRRK